MIAMLLSLFNSDNECLVRGVDMNFIGDVDIGVDTVFVMRDWIVYRELSSCCVCERWLSDDSIC